MDILISKHYIILPVSKDIEPYMANALAIGIAKKAWPDLCFKINIEPENEYLIYKNWKARDSLDKLGSDYFNTTIRLLSKPGKLTVIVDDPNTLEMKDIIAKIAADIKTYFKTELLPCPFCGSPAILYEEKNGCSVLCQNTSGQQCDMGNTHGNWTREYAIKTWNRRTQDDEGA